MWAWISGRIQDTQLRTNMSKAAGGLLERVTRFIEPADLADPGSEPAVTHGMPRVSADTAFRAINRGLVPMA